MQLIALSLLLILSGAKPISVDSNTSKVLFTLGRSPDPNEIIYEINQDESGEIDRRDPVNEYWLRHTKGGITEPLTWVQEHFGFGIKVVTRTQSTIIGHFAAYKKRTITIKSHRGKVKAFIESGGKNMLLDRVFLNVEGGTFWMPNITEVTLYLTDPESGMTATEKIIP